MALAPTIRTLSIDLADIDRGVYETLQLTVAQHPSESDDHLIGRVFAYCLEHREGIEFSRGVSSTEEPAIMVRDLTGRITHWIEMGTPSAERLHKASKAVERVAVYLHRAPGPYLTQLAEAKVHRLGEIDFRLLDRALIAAMVARLDRRMRFALSVQEGQLFVTIDGVTLEGTVESRSLA